MDDSNSNSDADEMYNILNVKVGLLNFFSKYHSDMADINFMTRLFCNICGEERLYTSDNDSLQLSTTIKVPYSMMSTQNLQIVASKLSQRKHSLLYNDSNSKFNFLIHFSDGNKNKPMKRILGSELVLGGIFLFLQDVYHKNRDVMISTFEFFMQVVSAERNVNMRLFLDLLKAEGVEVSDFF